MKFLAISEHLMLFPLTAAHDKKWLGICKYEEPEAQHQSVRMLAQPTYPDHGPGRVVHGGGGASSSPHKKVLNGPLKGC